MHHLQRLRTTSLLRGRCVTDVRVTCRLQVSGLSEWLGEQLEVFSDIDKWGMLFILCLLTAAMTEVTSNTAISILLLPILSSLVSHSHVCSDPSCESVNLVCIDQSGL